MCVFGNLAIYPTSISRNNYPTWRFCRTPLWQSFRKRDEVLTLNKSLGLRFFDRRLGRKPTDRLKCFASGWFFDGWDKTLRAARHISIRHRNPVSAYVAGSQHTPSRRTRNCQKSHGSLAILTNIFKFDRLHQLAFAGVIAT